MDRRKFLKSASLVAVAAVVGVPFPARAEIAQLDLVIPASAGGGWDLTGRVVAQVLGQTGAVGAIQVENIPGAGGTVALPQFLARTDAEPSIMMTGLTIVSAAITNSTANTIAEATPLARLVGEAHVLVVPADSEYADLAAFVAALKENPGAVSVTGGTPGGSDHITLGLLALANDIDPLSLSWIAYDGGGQAQTAVLGGHVSAAISNWSEFAGQIQAGRLRALAISADRAIPGIDAPTFRDQGQDVVLYNWRGLFAPTKVSPELRAEYEAAITAMVESQEWKDEVARRNWIDLYLPREEFEPVLTEEIATITALMTDLGFA